MSVVMPPRMVTNDKGISTLPAPGPKRLARVATTGMKITTTGVLFMKALTNAASTRVIHTSAWRRRRPKATRR